MLTMLTLEHDEMMLSCLFWNLGFCDAKDHRGQTNVPRAHASQHPVKMIGPGHIISTARTLLHQTCFFELYSGNLT